MEDVKKALAVIKAHARKDDAKSYRQLVGLLDKARKKLSDVEEQWENFRAQWANYLDNATKMSTAHRLLRRRREQICPETSRSRSTPFQQVRTQLR